MSTHETSLEQQREQRREPVAVADGPDRRVDPARSRRSADRRRPGAPASPPRSGPDPGAGGPPRARPGPPREGVRAALVLVVTALVALGGGWAVTAVTPESYQTRAKVLVLPAGDAQGGSLATSASAVAVQVPTWAALAQTPAVLDPALEASGVDMGSTQAVDHVSASPEPGTSIVSIEVDAPGGREAAALASATAASLVEQIAARSTVGETVLVTGSVVEEPEVPVRPASPDLLLNLAVALAVGLAVGAAVLVAVRAATVRRGERRAGGGEHPASAG